jgi:asparagine synthase (glutamine-hydrolysing)
LLKVGVAIIDANDIGVNVLGASKGVDVELIKELFKDNPLGQTTEQTPLCIVRKI